MAEASNEETTQRRSRARAAREQEPQQSQEPTAATEPAEQAEQAEPPVAEREQVEAPPASPEAVDQESHGLVGWRERARTRFGVSPHAVAGALHDLAADELITENDARQRIDAFLSQEVSS